MQVTGTKSAWLDPELGRQEGERRLLQRLLTRRFGDLPEWVTPRLEQAGVEELEAWTDRVLDAGALEEVFQA